MDRTTMGSFLAALRRSAGLTQRELAEKLNVSDKAVSRWERDESAPDLTLIPVIAEIFGVTSDELLRGGRASPSRNANRETAKTELQIQNLLTRAQTHYQIHCLISVTVALLGLIAALAVNLGFLRAYVAFFAGCALFLAAIVCQVIFLILVRSSIPAQSLPDSLVAPLKRKQFLGAEAVFGTVFVLMLVCLPLIVFPVGPYSGLTLRSWLFYGSLFGSAGAVIWLIGCAAVNLRRGYWSKPDFQSPQNQFRRKWLRKTVLMMALLVLLHGASVTLLSRNSHLFVRGSRFENWDDFRRFMEIPTDTDGTPLTFLAVEGTGEDTVYLYENQAGNPVALRKEDVSQILYKSDDNSTELVRYRHLNRQIVSVHLNRGNLPVQAFSAQQMLLVQICTFVLHMLWALAYVFTGTGSIREYRRKIKSIHDKSRP